MERNSRGSTTSVLAAFAGLLASQSRQKVSNAWPTLACWSGPIVQEPALVKGCCAHCCVGHGQLCSYERLLDGMLVSGMFA